MKGGLAAGLLCSFLPLGSLVNADKDLWQKSDVFISGNPPVADGQRILPAVAEELKGRGEEERLQTPLAGRQRRGSPARRRSPTSPSISASSQLLLSVSVAAAVGAVLPILHAWLGGSLRRCLAELRGARKQHEGSAARSLWGWRSEGDGGGCEYVLAEIGLDGYHTDVGEPGGEGGIDLLCRRVGQLLGIVVMIIVLALLLLRTPPTPWLNSRRPHGPTPGESTKFGEDEGG